jgi:hypothetical protein
VVLPKEAVKRLRAAAGSCLFLIEGGDGTYQLTPHDPAFEEMLARAEEIMAGDRGALQLVVK